MLPLWERLPAARNDRSKMLLPQRENVKVWLPDPQNGIILFFAAALAYLPSGRRCISVWRIFPPAGHTEGYRLQQTEALANATPRLRHLLPFGDHPLEYIIRPLGFSGPVLAGLTAPLYLDSNGADDAGNGRAV